MLATNTKVPPRCFHSRGRGTESYDLPARWTLYRSGSGAPLAESRLPEPPTKEEPTMSSTLMIPPTVIPRVREGAVALLAQLGDELGEATWYPEQCEPLYKRLQAQWAMLDVIGWNDEDDTGEMVEADIARIGRALKLAADEITPSLKQWLGEMGEDDPERPKRADELRLMQQFRAQIRAATKREAGMSAAEPNPHLIAFGRAVRHLRADQNISAGELAVAAGLTPGRLDAIEAGRFDPAYDVLLALAHGLSVTVAAVVDRAEAELKGGA